MNFSISQNILCVFTWVIAYRYLILESTIKDFVTGRSTLRLINLKLLWNLMYQSEAPWLNLWPFVDGKVHRVIHKIEVTNNLQSYSFIVALQLKQCSLYILQASCRSSFALVSCCNNEFLSNILQWKKRGHMSSIVNKWRDEVTLCCRMTPSCVSYDFILSLENYTRRQNHNRDFLNS